MSFMQKLLKKVNDKLDKLTSEEYCDYFITGDLSVFDRFDMDKVSSTSESFQVQSINYEPLNIPSGYSIPNTSNVNMEKTLLCQIITRENDYSRKSIDEVLIHTEALVA